MRTLRPELHQHSQLTSLLIICDASAITTMIQTEEQHDISYQSTKRLVQAA